MIFNLKLITLFFWLILDCINQIYLSQKEQPEEKSTTKKEITTIFFSLILKRVLVHVHELCISLKIIYFTLWFLGNICGNSTHGDAAVQELLLFLIQFEIIRWRNSYVYCFYF